MYRVKVRPLGAGGRPTLLRAGGWQQTAACDLTLSPCPELRLPSELFSTLGLEPGQELHLLAGPDGGPVWMGPLVGVLLPRRALRRLNGQGDQRFRQMAGEARAAGAHLYLFGVDDVDRQSRRVHGWMLQEGHWVQMSLPLPDLIYNRATHRTARRRGIARALLRQLTELDGVVLLNTANAFSKWEVHASLRFFADTEHLSPDTVPFRDPSTLIGMLTRDGQAFIKADHGSHGNNVLRAETVAGGWEVRGQSRGHKIHEAFASLEELDTFLRLLKGKRRWVVQQAIELPEVEGRLFDLRAIAQKDGTGEWAVPLVLVRWAQPGEITTNTSRGAEPLLPAQFRERAGQALTNLPDLEETAAAVARLTATALESRFGRLCEVGVDIGLDRSGRPWVLEANAKPLHRSLNGLPAPLMRNPLRYAVYLTGRLWSGRRTALWGP